MILETSDFDNGITKLGQNDLIEADLETYFTDAIETAMIYMIMGKIEGDLFIADLDVNGEPQTAKWTAIFSEFNWVYGSSTWFNIGLKEILKYFVYSEYVGGQGVFNQIGGNYSLNQEASTPESLVKKADVIWNRGVMNVANLQSYMNDNLASYPDLEAQAISFNSPI